ncbi:putative peptidoglycan lipid II flippase [Pseudochelatococcus lubricantis]|uniref:Probable lipid II flippase MurJ n=1 Tax=Pseudochelatococcus lubricantis TaxID=1538102 RepID=A0ABX0UZK8_9HYPH|nr:murein biosynthesis integral membrane protein MurJ [Pseudochelatococcus lubricantis]NIJ58167.1 putative peptidoglycan lipid II flippase [Pseudochelatococcus lubricantis]
MLKHFISVSGFTLLSRVTGLFRDLATAAVLGAGLIADAFFVALRLPNHFRAIFSEGAFNAAFIPAFTRLHEAAGVAAARRFADNVWTTMLIVQTLVLGIALTFMPQVVTLLAPGFAADPEKFALAVTLTRITFPYLFFITLVTLVSGVLNGVERFAAAAGAPILLNVAIVAALALAFLFPSAAHAAAWGVAAAGVLELALVYGDAHRAGIAPRLARPRLDDDMRTFLKALGPAVIGSAGVQIALFADTIIASLLPTGAVSSIYYADRLYQLPIGVIALAAGTVVLPEMSRLIAANRDAAAHAAQNRTLMLALALGAPCMVAFLIVPDLIMSALFGRGAFTAADAQAAGAVLAAYAFGLPAIVAIPALVASFRARLDTATPAVASLIGIAVNVALKIALAGDMGAPGLALATAVGAWVNGGLLYILAIRKQWTAPDGALGRTLVAVAVACVALAVAAYAAQQFAEPWIVTLPRLQAIIHLAIVAGVGALVYGATLLGGLKALRVPIPLRRR